VVIVGRNTGFKTVSYIPLFSRHTQGRKVVIVGRNTGFKTVSYIPLFSTHTGEKGGYSWEKYRL
jgi:hypothetical protein